MKRYAFFVGIDSYENGITQLRCACNDASELYGKFYAAGFDKAVLIAEKDAESGKLLRQVNEFCKNIQSGDLMVFYFAGHGREFDSKHYLVAEDDFPDAEEGYTVGNGNALQTTAVPKCHISDSFHTVGNDNRERSIYELPEFAERDYSRQCNENR